MTQIILLCSDIFTVVVIVLWAFLWIDIVRMQKDNE